MPLLLILALAIALLTVLFALQNTAPVAINFFIWQFQDRLALILLITLALGVLVGLLVCTPSIVRRSLTINALKRKLGDRDYRLQTTDQDIVTIRQASDELLAALALIEPSSGLLKSEAVISGVIHLLEQRRANPSPSKYGSVCIYILEVGLADGAPLDLTLQQRVYPAIATRLRHVAPPGSWLYHDGVGRFTCIATGMDTQTASNQGETLRAALTHSPLQLDGSTPLPLTVSLGGAIASPTEHLDASSLLHQAEEALDHAKKRGRNRFRFIEARG